MILWLWIKGCILLTAGMDPRLAWGHGLCHELGNTRPRIMLLGWTVGPLLCRSLDLSGTCGRKRWLRIPCFQKLPSGHHPTLSHPTPLSPICWPLDRFSIYLVSAPSILLQVCTQVSVSSSRTHSEDTFQGSEVSMLAQRMS